MKKYLFSLVVALIGLYPVTYIAQSNLPAFVSETIQRADQILADKQTNDPSKDFKVLYDGSRFIRYYKHDYQQAERYLTRALSIMEKHPGKVPSHYQIGLYKNYGTILIHQGFITAGSRAFDQGWAYITKHEKRHHQDLQFLEYKADFLSEWGRNASKFEHNLFRSIELSEASWKAYANFMAQIDQKAQQKNLAYQAQVAENLGKVYSEIGAYQIADGYLNRALEILDQAQEQNDQINAVRVAVNFNLATNYMNAGIAKESDSLLNCAKKIFLDIKENSSSRITQLTYTPGSLADNIGIVYRELREFRLAKKYFQFALDYYTDHQNSEGQSKVFDNWGDLLSQQGLYHAAIQTYQEGIVLHLSSTPPSPYTIPQSIPDFAKTNVRYFLRSIGSKAHAFKELAGQNSNSDSVAFYLGLADKTYAYALNIIDSLQRRYLDQNFQIFLISEVYSIYEGAIEVAIQQNLPVNAWEIALQAKSGFLRMSINQQAPQAFYGVDAAIVQKERALLHAIAFHRSSRAEDSNLRYLAAQKALDSLINAIAQNPAYQDYYQYRFGRNECSILDIQEMLDDSSSIIQYFTGDENTYAFHLTQDHVEVISFQLEDTVISEMLRLNWYKQSLSPLAFNRQYQAVAFPLFKILMGGFTQKVQPNVVIVPDGTLSYIPFDALVTSEDPEVLENPDKLPAFAVNEYCISYTFFPCGFNRTPERNSLPDNLKLLAFAPSFSALTIDSIDKEDQPFLEHQYFSNQSIDSMLHSFMGYDIPNKNEVDSIATYFEVDLFPGKKALLGRFIYEAPSYQAIHLATHGQYSDLIPDANRIIFTIIEDSVDNESLYPRMLYGMELTADLVVLSACESSLGDINRGEGMTSVAYAFSYAGVKSTVASLWKVNTNSNGRIITSFYKYLERGYSKAKALQQAKIDYLTSNEQIEPYFWAATILNGNREAIFKPQFFIFKGISIMTIAILILVIIFRKHLPSSKGKIME